MVKNKFNAVKDNSASGRFEMAVDGATAFVSYRLTKSAVVLVHTEVPKALEGRGIGSALAKGVLDLLRTQGRKAVVVCAFIAAFVRKHPEYDDLLAAPLRDPEHEQLDKRLDEALEESFPASDSPAVTPRR
ncbi:MAG TPA: GNAT family N-acetyltransferase [Rhizomicrobium sp.]